MGAYLETNHEKHTSQLLLFNNIFTREVAWTIFVHVIKPSCE